MALKKKYKVAIGITLGLAALVFLASIVISKIVSNKVSELLKEQNIEHFNLSIDRTKFSLFDRSLVFSDIHFAPTNASMSKLKNNQLGKTSLQKISIRRIKLRGIQLGSLIFNKQIEINKLIIDDPLYQQFSNGKKQTLKKDKPFFDPDSIHIKKLEGFHLSLIKLTNLKVQLIDLNSDKITFENKPLSFEVTGIKLDKISDDYFKLSPVSDTFDMTKIKVNFPNIKYSFSIGELKYHFGDDYLQIANIKFKPFVNKLTLANSYIYNKDLFDIGVKKLKIFNLDFEKLVSDKGIFMDSIIISELSLDVYKDKRKPFDLSKRPKFPHQLLKEMKTPLHIQKVAFQDSELIYEEKLEHKDLLMHVTMHDLNVNIFNVTSIKKYRKTPLKIDWRAKFMGKGDLYIDMILPLANNQETFYFSGYLGPSKMKYYDSAIIPALGLKVLNGQIESLSFKGTANDYTSQGTMKFLYHDLQGEVFKVNKTEKNSFLSWSVNNLIHKSNPGKNGEVREATMEFNRVIYKGFGNFIWKTIQSGLVNTIAPFGMTTEKEANKKKRKLRRQERRKKKNK